VCEPVSGREFWYVWFLPKILLSSCVWYNYLFIDKTSLFFFPFNCLVFKKLKNILIFHFPFLQFWFPCLNFFFFQKGNINIDSIKLLNDFEISVLKIKCVKNVFWIFNFFEMTLKILKTMQIHQKYTFLRFFVVFFYFYFSKK